MSHQARGRRWRRRRRLPKPAPAFAREGLTVPLSRETVGRVRSATRRLAVSKLVTFSLAALAALAVVVSPTTAAPAEGPEGELTVGLASDLGPSRGGPSNVPKGWIPLHAHEFALAKAAANERAGVGSNRPQAGRRRRRIWADRLELFERLAELQRQLPDGAHAAGYHGRDRPRPLHRDREHAVRDLLAHREPGQLRLTQLAHRYLRRSLRLQPERPADDVGREDAALLLLRRLLRRLHVRQRARVRLEQDGHARRARATSASTTSPSAATSPTTRSSAIRRTSCSTATTASRTLRAPTRAPRSRP